MRSLIVTALVFIGVLASPAGDKPGIVQGSDEFEFVYRVVGFFAGVNLFKVDKAAALVFWDGAEQFEDCRGGIRRPSRIWEWPNPTS